jgi:hypothetical protein
MAFLAPNKESFRFKRIIAAGLFLTLFDGFIYGSPVFGLLICSLVFVASGIAAIIYIFLNKEFSKIYAVKCFIYLCACTCIISAYRLNISVGNRNADEIINTVEKFKEVKGDYPRRLSELVPEYMSRVPVCAYRLAGRQYHYSYTGTSHYLMWAQLPPFGRRVYDFQDKGWAYLD